MEEQLLTEDIDFKVYDGANKKQQIGNIARKYAGFKNETYNAQHYLIAISPDLGVNFKVLLLGATFLIDYMVYNK